MAKLLVLDGFSLAFRAFFALPETMVTASGQYTNAIYGFTSMLLNLIKDHNPTHLAVAFDHPDPTFRDALSPVYKGTRSKTPESLLSQLALIGQLVKVLGIALIEAPGYEADDVIATISEIAKNGRIETIIVTGDRDSFQLVSDPYVRVLYNRRGVSDYELLDETGVEERMGVSPALYPQFAALRGDPSDNILGVPGVGAKTAAKLLNQYGSLEGIMNHLEALTPKLRESLEDYADQVELNTQLIPLVRDVPLRISLEDLAIGEWDLKSAQEMFEFLEFHRIWSRTLTAFRSRPVIGATSIEVDMTPTSLPSVTIDVSLEIARNVEALDGYLGRIDKDVALYLAPSWSGQPGRSQVNSIALAGNDVSGGVGVLGIPDELLSQPGITEAVFTKLAASTAAVSGVGLKEVLRFVSSMGWPLFSVGIDGAVAAYLLNPSASSYDLDSLLELWMGRIPDMPNRIVGSQLTMDLSGVSDIRELCKQAESGLLLTGVIDQALGEKDLENLYLDIEKPLISVLAKMEALGILVDRDYLVELQREFALEVAELQREIQEIAGTSFNVNSTQQLGKILFEGLGLPPSKKTKTGYSTDARSLERLVDLHPIVAKIMRYREVEKLRSTYGQGLISEIGIDGRIHASFSQTVARTGRLSSDHPNLHNIPIRTQDGRRFRNAFIAPPGRSFVVADYSQIELRVIAHLSKDPGLIEAFANNIDIHKQTASHTFGVPLNEVTSAQRNKAKMVAYGLAYGMEAYGLSQRLGVSVSEADAILKAFFSGFPQLSTYMASTIAQAKRDGFTTTEFGRIRPLPELNSNNFRLREAAERQAMNAGIQGLAADIFKVALVKLDQALEHFEARIVLQVHDEVIVECEDGILSEVEKLVKKVLERAVELSVPLDVNVSTGRTWASAK